MAHHIAIRSQVLGQAQSRAVLESQKHRLSRAHARFHGHDERCAL